jgi:hypothetical protein
MAKYLLVYYGGRSGQTDKERAEQMQAWGAWFGKLGKAVVDAGNPFTPAVKTVASNGAVKDGPIGTQATGYSIVEAGSSTAASDLAKGCPVLQTGGQIAVYETFNAM